MNFKRRRSAKVKKVFKNVTNLLIAELLEILEETNKKKLWVRNWIAKRNSRGGSALLLKELYSEDPREYMSFLRMSSESFEALLNVIKHDIQKADTSMRDAIPARVKLEITLSHLATGNNYRSLQHFFRVSKSAISRFIPEVCDAICTKLKDHIVVPSTNEEWARLERGFRQKWNFPKCYGALDGKHIEIRHGSAFFNYKKSNSIVLMALVDYDYCFTYIDVGANGSASDGAVFRNCSLFEELENNLLPQDGVIVGDDAFPLKPYLMKPYSQKNLNYEAKIFNYRLSRCRRIVENAFGILVSRFRIFEKSIACKLNTVDKIVYTACTLHNWLRHNSTRSYLPQGSLDVEDTTTGQVITGTWRSQIRGLKSVGHFGTNHYSRQAKAIRDEFKRYFINEGQVPWQNMMIY